MAAWKWRELPRCSPFLTFRTYALSSIPGLRSVGRLALCPLDPGHVIPSLWRATAVAVLKRAINSKHVQLPLPDLAPDSCADHSAANLSLVFDLCLSRVIGPGPALPHMASLLPLSRLPLLPARTLPPAPGACTNVPAQTLIQMYSRLSSRSRCPTARRPHLPQEFLFRATPHTRARPLTSPLISLFYHYYISGSLSGTSRAFFSQFIRKSG